MTSPGRVNRGPRAAADNRAALIAAARRVFASSGFDAPLSSIARTAGVGQGVLYRHFPSRDAIALAVFDENIAEVEALAADPETRVDTVLEVIVEQITASAAFVAMLRPTGSEPRLLAVAQRFDALIAKKLADPAQRGDLDPALDAADVVLAVAMLANVLSESDPAARGEIAQRAWRLLRRGLAPR
ncbi:TetR/AcrR family transcriptional regulator [Nocardia asteroides]|uniref:TetR/AcrR family transcriptional regulator n=1 Tax=Nocardia asteroides TaxID=1824 RepID=UPI001E361A13|nr:TetR/AcrR family transcriptional regulator [Nocardia asteroides]UGT60473.1 TetR/AcrR family transcriptional regulator; helix-turn-helix transcriptional regulator [Nocardia asteroides]